MNRHILAAGLLAAALPGFIATASAQAPQPPRGIVNIAPDLYRAQNNNHYTVFLVTSEGIIMSDPINRDFATWLKGELQTRFKQPVRYVLYTHHDWDHASGGSVFADTAQFIAHENMPETLTVPNGNLALPANLRKADANGNGRLERTEAPEGLRANFRATDANGDGALSGAELVRGALNDVHPPTLTYADRHTVTLGGKTVVMIHTGVAHATDMSVLFFPAERTIFSADLVQARRFPGAVGPTVGSWIAALRTVEALDFDIAATGHALSGRKEDVVALRQYLEELSTGVAAGIAAGRSVKELQQSLNWDKYKAWERFGVQPQIHIAQVYETMRGAN